MIFIIENRHTMTNREIGVHIGKSQLQVADLIFKFKLGRHEASWRERAWSQSDVEYLIANYKTKGDMELALDLNILPPNKGKKRIEKKRNYLNLHRTKDELLLIKRRNAFIFPPFRHKGETHHNFEPIGAIKVWEYASGRRTLVIKVADGQYNKTQTGAWEFYRHHAWRRLNGPLPDNCIIRFKGDDPLDTAQYTKENLIAITRAEHGLMNKTKWPLDLIKAVSLLKELEQKLEYYESQ